MSQPIHNPDMLPSGDEMARRRMQLRGSLKREGRWWRLRWWEDELQADGAMKRCRRSAIIGPCIGPERMTEKKARAAAWDQVLRHVNASAWCPQSMMTLRQFVTQRFEPEHVFSLKHAGKEHYKYCLSKILPALGDVKLRDLRMDTIQGLLRDLLREGKSVQTAAHMKTALHAIIEHAKRVGHFAGDNPASLVRLPDMVRRKISALTFDQAVAALNALPEPVRTMAFLSMTTSPNVAELCGLRWSRVNLSDAAVPMDGESLPPRAMLIVENWYRNRPGTVKTGRRNRIVPLPAQAVSALADWRTRSPFTAPADYVFASRTGKPIDAHNTNSRLFRPVGAAIGAKLTWHILRHSCATFAEQSGMVRSDRIALMGHATGGMTDRYTHADVERMREGVEWIAGKLALIKAGSVLGTLQEKAGAEAEWIQ